MEGRCILSLASSKSILKFGSCKSSCPFEPTKFVKFHYKQEIMKCGRSSCVVASSVVSVSDTSSSSSCLVMPKMDKSGRFCSPRAARELAILIAYAACLEGCDPVRVFENRLNAKREPGYEFNKAMLLEYNHLSFGGPPVSTQTEDEEQALLHQNEEESMIEAEVLLAPPKLVYSKLILRLTKKMLVAVVDAWDKHALVIDKIAPLNWKRESGSRILELCILRLAMAEITELGTRHQIVINEAVHLAKRFCDGTAPHIINGCLRTFVQNQSAPNARGN